MTERGQTKKIWLYQKLGLLEKLGLLGKLVYFVREPEQMVENIIYQLVSVKSILFMFSWLCIANQILRRQLGLKFPGT